MTTHRDLTDDFEDALTESRRDGACGDGVVTGAVPDSIQPNTPDSPTWWQEHGIDLEIAESLPVVRYRKGDLEPVREHFAGFAANQVRQAERTAKKVDGLLYVKYPIPTVDLPPIPPQLRPDVAIKKPQKAHHHPEVKLPARTVVVNPQTGKPLKETRVSTMWAMRLHVLKDKPKGHGGWEIAADRFGIDDHTKRKQLLRDKSLEPVLLEVLRLANNEEPHSHPNEAKYLHAETPKEPLEHDHRDYKRASFYRRHLERHHNGQDVEGRHRHDGVEFDEILIDVEDPRRNPAKRFETHPLAWERFEAAEVIFIGIEGTLKLLAMLSYILRNGGCVNGDMAASVCAVPAVGQWEAPELEQFVGLLRHKLAVIVPDADWYMNEQVYAQALLFQKRIGAIAVEQGFALATCIAAPPIDRIDEGIKGVDDFIGAGGKLEELRAIGFELPPAFVTWAGQYTQQQRRDAAASDVLTMMAISLLGGLHGQTPVSLQKLARFIGINDDRVERALKRRLIPNGLIETDKPLETARWVHRTNAYRDPDLGFVERPIIQITNRELWAVESEQGSLSDWLHLYRRHSNMDDPQSADREKTDMSNSDLVTALERLAEKRPNFRVTIDFQSTPDPTPIRDEELAAALEKWRDGEAA